MDVKELLREILSQLNSSSFEDFKWSLKTTLHYFLGQLQNADTVVELMQKSSADCLELTITILKDIPRLDLVHKLRQDFNSENKETMDTQRVILETVKDLTFAEYNKFTSSLEIELANIWKQRLDNADLSQVIQLMVTMFSQDPVVLTKRILDKVGRTDLINKLSYLTSTDKDTIHAQESICKILSNLSHKEFKQFKHHLTIFLPHIAVRELEKANRQEIDALMERNSYYNCIEMTERVLKRMERPDLAVNTLSRSISAETFADGIWTILNYLNSEEFKIFTDCLRNYLPHIPERPLQKVDSEEIVKMIRINIQKDCANMTESIFKEMERPDLLSRLLHHASETQESGTTKKCILNVLKNLTSTELNTYKHHLEKTLPHISVGELHKANFQTVILLMERNLCQNYLEITQKLLIRIDRPDLVQESAYLTHGADITDMFQSFGGYEEWAWSEERFVILMFEKRNVMESVLQALLVTLCGLSNMELQRFHEKVGLKRSPSVEMDPEETVFWIVLQHGQHSVQKVTDVFVDMGLTEQAQRLMDSFSKPARHPMELLHSIWPDLALVPVVKELLLDTVHDLSYRELIHFQWFVQFTCFESGISWLHLYWERQTQEFKITGTLFSPSTAKEACEAMISAVVAKHGVLSLSVMKAVFINMNRYDLANRMELILRLKERRQWPALNDFIFECGKVEQMVAVINLLMETLGHLSVRELNDLKHTLNTGPYHAIMWYRLAHIEISHLVFCIVQTYGLKSVEITKKLLGSIGRMDLEQILFKDNSNEGFPEFWLSELILKVAKMAVVNELLEKTLNQLSCKELKLFKKLLLLKNVLHKASLMDMRLWAITTAEETVTLLLQIYGWEALEMTHWVLVDMNRSDLAQQLSAVVSNTRRPSEQKVAAVEDLRGDLCRELSRVEIGTFKWMLQVTYFHFGLEWIPETVLQGECDAEDLSDLIIETSGQKSMEVIKDVLKHEPMNRSHLPESEIDFGGADKCWSSGCTEADSDSHSFHQVSADMEKVVVVLQEVTDQNEMQSLKKHLQLLCENNVSRSFVKNYVRMYPGMNNLVEITKAIYGESRCVAMIKSVLTKMERSDLVEKMSELCFTSAAWNESVDLKSCINAMDVSLMQDVWTILKPEVNKTDKDKQSTYRLESDAGSYECSVSGLRWRCEEKVSFQFKFGLWEEHMERVETMQYMPAGPLIDLTVSSGRLDVVYLPHWICIDSPNIEEGVAVLHSDDCGDTVEKVAEVTSTHVKLCEPIFSPRAVLLKLGLPVKIYCSVLIYKTNTASLTLHVYLIPCDPGLKESMDKQEQEYGNNIIPKPHPDKSLKVRDRFLLTADKETVEINPEKLTLRYQSPPNFFEVYCKSPDFDFRLELEQETEHVPVWSCIIRQDDYAEEAHAVPNVHGIHFVDRFRTELIQRVSRIAQILDHMLQKDIINQEIYDSIMTLDTTQNKMRALFSGPLKSSGDKGKDIFYQILKRKEKILCAELEKIHIK